MANENATPLTDLNQKAEHIQDVLKKLDDIKNELAEFGMNLNENISTDKDKWASYWGL